MELTKDKERLEEIAFGDSEHDAEKVEMARVLLASLEEREAGKTAVMYKGGELLTKAGLELIRDGVCDATELESMAMARALLAAMEQQGRNPVLSYADSYRDMAKQGVESVSIWSVITDLERNIAPLYAAPQLPQPAVMKLPVQHWEELCRQNPDMSIGDAIMRAAWWNHCAAMLQGAEPVSQPDELPLDYLQGHKDGLEWAARLVEANHPQTGDWLYDDPVELAKAIRKGPDMPELNSAPADADDNFYSWFCREWEQNYQPNGYSLSAKKHLGAMAESAWFACRGAMLQGAEPSAILTPAIFIDGNISPDDADKLADAISKLNSEHREPQQMIAEPVTGTYTLPAGWVAVPVDATRAMIDAARRVEEDGYDAMHKAMIAAAPQEVR